MGRKVSKNRLDMRTKKVVLVDLYGTLVDITKQQVRPFDFLYDKISKKVKHIHKDEFDRFCMTKNLTAIEICENYGVTLSKAHKKAFFDMMLREMLSVSIIDSVAHYIKRLKSLGLKIAIISNLTKEYSSPALLFDVDLKILSYEVGLLKPNHEIFQIALDYFGVEAKDCLMIGDNENIDTQPFIDMGGNAICVGDLYGEWLRKQDEGERQQDRKYFFTLNPRLSEDAYANSLTNKLEFVSAGTLHNHQLIIADMGSVSASQKNGGKIYGSIWSGYENDVSIFKNDKPFSKKIVVPVECNTGKDIYCEMYICEDNYNFQLPTDQIPAGLEVDFECMLDFGNRHNFPKSYLHKIRQFMVFSQIRRDKLDREWEEMLADAEMERDKERIGYPLVKFISTTNCIFHELEGKTDVLKFDSGCAIFGVSNKIDTLLARKNLPIGCIRTSLIRSWSLKNNTLTVNTLNSTYVFEYLTRITKGELIRMDIVDHMAIDKLSKLGLVDK